jgi:hypothetical protein
MPRRAGPFAEMAKRRQGETGTEALTCQPLELAYRLGIAASPLHPSPVSQQAATGLLSGRGDHVPKFRLRYWADSFFPRFVISGRYFSDTGGAGFG